MKEDLNFFFKKGPRNQLVKERDGSYTWYVGREGFDIHSLRDEKWFFDELRRINEDQEDFELNESELKYKMKKFLPEDLEGTMRL